MYIKTFFSIIVIGFILISCERNVEFADEISKPLIVVNSFVTPDSTVTAYISTSRFFLKDSIAFRNVNNAEVSLWINDVLKEKLNFVSDGTYKGSYKPVITDKIKLTVDIPQMNQASSIASFIQSPIVLSVDTQKILAGKEILMYSPSDTMSIKYNYKINYKLKFADNANQKNYYRLILGIISYTGVWNEFTNKVDTIARPIYYSDFDFNDVVAENTTTPLTDGSTSPVAQLLLSTNNNYHVFSDDIFNGKTYSLQFSTNITKYVKDIHYGSLDNIKHEVYICLQSISKDYYLYLKTRSASYATNYFSEPVKIHNNINNGVGILGSYTTSNIFKINL